MPAPTGAHTTLWYLWEDDGFAQDPTDDEEKPFGGDATLTSFEGANNAVEVFEPNSREIEQLIAQHFEGSFTAEFELTNPWWLRAVIASPSTTDNSDGTYTHTFDGDTPSSMAITAGYEDVANSSGSGPAERTLEGCVVQTATIDVAVEDTVSVSLNGAYVQDSWDDSISDLTTQPSLDNDVQTFAEALLDLDSSTLSLVQDVSVEINSNVDIIREIGTRIGVDYSPKQIIPQVDYTKIRENHDEVAAMYGEAAATSVQESVDSDDDMTFTADNGAAAGSGQNVLDINLNGSFPDSVSTENLGNPQEDLQESINRRIHTVAAEATNETETAL